MAAPDYSGITSDIQGGYNVQRQRAQQQEAGQLQGQKDALNRRAAQLGGGPSGAIIAADQQAGNASAQRLQSANEGIDQAQNQELRGVKMTQLGQQFTSSEREAGQQFAAGQQEKQFGQQKELQGNEFGQQEKMQGEQFGQAQKMQTQQFSQQALMNKSNQDWQAAQTKIAQGIQQGQFDKNMGFEQEKFKEQTGVDLFNEHMAEKMSNKKDGLDTLFGNFSMGNLFGGGGGGGSGSFDIGGLTKSFGGGGGGGFF